MGKAVGGEGAAIDHPTDALGTRRYEVRARHDASRRWDRRRMGTAHRSGVFMIDASKGFIEDGNTNRLAATRPATSSRR